MEGDTSKYDVEEGVAKEPKRRKRVKRSIFEREANAIVKIGKIVRELPVESRGRVTLYMSNLLEESGDPFGGGESEDQDAEAEGDVI